MPRKNLLINACLLALLPCQGAFAITDDQSLGGMQITFSNPGSRALGMGGATLASSTDATGAFTNPAMLLNMSASAFSVEGKYSQFSTQFLKAGNTATPSSLEYKDDNASTLGAGFIGGAIVGEDWGLGFYRVEQANFASNINRSEVTVSSGDTLLNGKSDTDIDVTLYGVSFAKAVNDRFGVGGSIAIAQSGIRAKTVFGGDEEAFFKIDDDDNDVVASLGLRYKLNQNFTLAGSYRQGAQLQYKSTGIFNNPADGRDFSVPDTIGLGVGYVNDSNTFSAGLDINRVNYSSLTDDYKPLEHGSQGYSSALLKVEDGVEIRAGGEWRVPMGAGSAAIRAGIWYDPAHEVFVEEDGFIRGDDDLITCAALQADPSNTSLRGLCQSFFNATRAIFPEGEDRIHYSLGFGYTSGPWDISLGFDISENVNFISSSVSYRFGE